MKEVDKCCFNEEVDESLVQRIREGDKNAETKLVKKYRTDVLRIFYKVLENLEDAEDGTQELWIYLLRDGGLMKWKNLNKGSFKAWLYRVASNRAIDLLRKRRRRRKREEEYQPSLIDRVTPESEAISKEIDEIVKSTLNSLPVKQRVVFEMWLDGASYQVIADTLKIPDGTVATLIHRTKKKLREVLSEFPETS